MQRQVLTVLGATGSIGMNTLDVLGRHPERFEVFALSAYSQLERLAELCRRHRPRVAVVPDLDAVGRLRALLGTLPCEIAYGTEALEMVASASSVTTVMAAIVGAAGLGASLAAARAGKRVLLANKEALVMAGPVFMEAVRSGRASLLPIDSEHNAVFQSLPASHDHGLRHCGVRRIILTASGGPFRTTPREALEQVSPDQACAHPNWAMGRKISVDSATMMNKGLEVIEASYLFGVESARIEVLVHPQSIVHSMVEYEDGSVLAQLGNPDMRTPIAHALAYPERISAGVGALDLARIGRLDFEAPDYERFPCLRLAYAALVAGGGAPTVLNAANEEAVAAFLDRRLSFGRIPEVIAQVLDALGAPKIDSLADVLELDRRARERARTCLVERLSTVA